jgi:phosphomannomutase
MVSLATMQRQCDMGVVLTASHNPPEYNGFKLKGPFGGPAYPRIVAEVEALIPDAPAPPFRGFDHWAATDQVEYYDSEALYINHVKQSFDLKLIKQSGLALAYDAMYGAGQDAMRKLFPDARLLHCEVNPSFYGQAPEPIERNLQEFKALMSSGKFHWGLATDGDADRIGLFDHTGRFVDSHHILLLLIHYLHHYKKMTGKVVVTFSVTSAVQRLCAHYGLPIEVTKIGFKYIGEIMANETVLVGGEESGGIAVAGHAPERDGIYIGLVLLEFMARTGKMLPELIEEVYSIVGRFYMDRNDLHITEEKKQAVIAQCRAGAYSQFGSLRVERVEDLDGFKFHLAGGGWVMVRPSGTEPVLRVYAEGPDEATVASILSQTVETLLA